MLARRSVKLLFASVAAGRCVGSQVTGLPGLEPAGPAHSCRAPVLVGSSPGGEARLVRLAGVGGLSRLVFPTHSQLVTSVDFKDGN